MAEPNEKKYKILFADANDSILTVFRIFESELNELEKGKFDCDYSSSGTETLEKLSTNEYDLAIIDYYLPGMDGVQILKDLVINNIKTPVIFQTAKGNEKVAIDAFRLGLKDYFIKYELSFEELYSTILNTLNGDNQSNALAPVPEIPSLNFLTHHLESVLKGYQQEISEEDLVPGQEYIFAFMSTKIIHEVEIENYFTYEELKAFYKNIRLFINNNTKTFHGMKWIDKEDFLMHTFVGRNLISNCFMSALKTLYGIITYNLAQKNIPNNFMLRIALNYGEAKYEPNKEVVISSALNYNVHSIQTDDTPGLFISEFFYANMEDKSKMLFSSSFELEGVQNFEFLSK